MQVTKICIECSSEYSVPKYRAEITKYCSRKCLAKNRVQILHSITVPKMKGVKPVNFQGLSKKCLQCGIDFYLSPSRLEHKKFCSASCYAQYQKIDFDGGKYKRVNKSGVRFAIHRVIAEIILGRALDLAEIVHHIDGKKSNNSIDNLLIMNKKDHSIMHLKCKIHPANFESYATILLSSFLLSEQQKEQLQLLGPV
jgi:hypothetical protein